MSAHGPEHRVVMRVYVPLRVRELELFAHAVELVVGSRCFLGPGSDGASFDITTDGLPIGDAPELHLPLRDDDYGQGAADA